MVEHIVTKMEYEEFIKTYPKELVKYTTYICSPPLITYNDFTLGKWPVSIVARTWAYTDNTNDIWYKPEEERIYCIKKEEPNGNSSKDN